MGGYGAHPSVRLGGWLERSSFYMFYQGPGCDGKHLARWSVASSEVMIEGCVFVSLITSAILKSGSGMRFQPRIQ